MTHQFTHHDPLAPAPIAETLRYLGGLRNALSRRWWVGLIALHCVLLGCTILEANVLGYSVDALRGVAVPIVGTGERALMILVGVACAATFVGHCLRSIANYLIGIKLRRMSVDLKRNCLNSTLQAPIPDVMALGTGNVITRMTHDIDQPVTQFSQIGSRVMFMLLMFPFSIGAMTLIDYRFGVLALVIAIIFVPISKRWIGALPPVTNAMSAIEAERNATLLDTLRGLATFKAFRYGAWALDRMQTKSWAALQATATRVPYINRLLHLAQTISGVWVIAALGLGAWLTAHNHITAGAASAAVFLAVRAETQIFNTMFFLNDIQEGLTRLGRAVALAKLYTPTGQRTAPDLEKPAGVTIRGLEFSYPDTTEPVLPTLDLTLAAGTTTALVGASGAGKSTLAALMSGLLRPTAVTSPSSARRCTYSPARCATTSAWRPPPPPTGSFSTPLRPWACPRTVPPFAGPSPSASTPRWGRARYRSCRKCSNRSPSPGCCSATPTSSSSTRPPPKPDPTKPTPWRRPRNSSPGGVPPSWLLTGWTRR